MRTMDIRSQIIVCLGNGLYGCTPLTTQELAKFSNTKEKVIKKNENEIYQKLYRLLIDKCAGIKEIDRIRRDNKAASEKKTRDTVKNRRTLLTDKEHRRLLDEIAPERFDVLHYAALAVLGKRKTKRTFRMRAEY